MFFASAVSFFLSYVLYETVGLTSAGLRGYRLHYSLCLRDGCLARSNAKSFCEGCMNSSSDAVSEM